MKMKMLRFAALMAAAWLASTPLFAGVEDKGPETGSNKETPPRSAVTPAKPTKEKKRETYPFNGVIAEVDVTAKSLTLRGRESKRVILLTEQTRLEKPGGAAVFDDLKLGERIGGTLRKNPAGREEALLVRIGPKPESAAGPKPVKGGANVAAAP